LACSLEGQIANLADELAFSAHDLDDGLRSGLISPDTLQGVTLWEEMLADLGLNPCATLSEMDRHRIIRDLIGWGVTDAVQATVQRLADEGINSVEELRARSSQIIGLSAGAQIRHRELKSLLHQHLYRHWRVMRMAAKARRVLEALFNTYIQEPAQLPDSVQARIAVSEESLERVVCDYVAGMTDRFALDEYARLFDPAVRV
jgi:dGTPase